jgi:streptogramin lyase
MKKYWVLLDLVAVLGLLTASNGNVRPCFALVIVLMFTFQGLQVNSLNPATLQGASLTEWTVPTSGSGPWGLALDQSGTCCWFVEYYGNKIAHFDSQANSFEEWEIPTSDSNPYSISVTSVGGTPMVWGTEFSSDKIFVFSPVSGNFSEYLLPGASGPGYVSIEPQAGTTTRVWFTETTRNSNGEFVYDPSSGNVTFYEDTFPAPVGGGAYDVHAGSGFVWFAGFSALVRWDRASAQYTIWPLPNNESAVARFMSFDSRGEPWYTQGVADRTSKDNFVGVLRGNVIQEWRMPGAGSNPRGISINPLTQQPWIAEQSSLAGNGTVANLNDFGNGTLFFSSPITAPSGGTAIVLSPTRSHASASVHRVTPTTRSVVTSGGGPFAQYVLGPTLPSDVIVDSSGNVWVSEPGANKIAKLSVSNSDYALSVSSSSLSSAPGTSVPLAVIGTSVSGYTGDVTFTAPNLPPGVTLSGFDPNPVYIPSAGNASSHFAINIAPSATPGTSLVVIRGSDGTIAHTTGIILTIANSTSPNGSAQLTSQCPIPTYLLDLTLLSSLLADVLIGGVYIGLPVDAVSRRFHLLRVLSRKTWLVISLVGPSAVFVASFLFLLFC